MSDDVLTGCVIGCAYSVANVLGYGFLEKVYENALAHELRKSGLRVDQQRPVPVYYDGILVGDYFADLLVESEVIVELKVSKDITDVHLAQMINYLRATGLKRGLIISFGGSKVQVKRVSL